MNPWTATDFEYTHGTLLWAEFRDSKPDGWKRFEVGQHIYTPRREADEPLPGERPHAGWLYVSFSALSDQLRKYTSFGISLGVTGPPALAAEMQSLIHDIFGMRDARGWSNQLPAEPTLQVRARVANVIASTTSDRRIALVAYDAAIDAATSLRARISESLDRFVLEPTIVDRPACRVKRSERSCYAASSARNSLCGTCFWMAHFETVVPSRKRQLCTEALRCLR